MFISKLWMLSYQWTTVNMHLIVMTMKKYMATISMGIPELSWIHSYVEWIYSKLVWFHSNLEWIHTSMWQFFGELRALNIFKNSKCIYVTWPSKNFLYNVNQSTSRVVFVKSMLELGMISFQIRMNSFQFGIDSFHCKT